MEKNCIMKTDKDFYYFQEWRKEDPKVNLIPVHINKMRSENYFWNWSSDKGDWIRGEEIPENLKKGYNNPVIKSNYKKQKKNNEAMKPTQRTYTNVETGKNYRLFHDSNTGEMELRPEGETQEIFNGAIYFCAFDAVTIRLNNDRRISLGAGEFYALKPGEKVTHRKFAGFKQFRRV